MVYRSCSPDVCCFHSKPLHVALGWRPRKWFCSLICPKSNPECSASQIIFFEEQVLHSSLRETQTSQIRRKLLGQATTCCISKVQPVYLKKGDVMPQECAIVNPLLGKTRDTLWLMTLSPLSCLLHFLCRKRMLSFLFHAGPWSLIECRAPINTNALCLSQRRRKYIFPLHGLTLHVAFFLLLKWHSGDPRGLGKRKL